MLSFAFLVCCSQGASAQETVAEPAAKEHNPGYLHVGLNYSLNTRVPNAGFIFGLGSEFYIGTAIAQRLHVGMNMGWFSLSGNFGDDRGTGELQFLKPGLLFAADLSDAFTIMFKYSVMPTVGYNFAFDPDNNNNYAYNIRDFAHWGLGHGPYLGMSYKQLMVGFEVVVGNYWSEIDEDDPDLYYAGWYNGYSYAARPFYDRSANTFRFLVGINY
ncbi:MAG: hypothetical protein IPK99_17210 [Flavobacteriales bacterium]|nr:hypothetical protein [Flavobacteriales bacterium]